MTLTAFVSVLAIHLLAAISPGPSFVVSVRTAATEGFGTAVALALGFGLGAGLWAVAALVGLALLFEAVPRLLTLMTLGGAAFLLWIALQIWRHAAEPLPDRAPDAPPPSGRAAFRLGFLTFATNPKPAVFFGAVFVGLVPPEAGPGWLLAIVIGVIANETLWYILVARVFSVARARAAYGRAKPVVDRALALLIAGFAVKIALG